MSIADRAKEIGWYHSLELTPELRTDGMFDLRPYVEHYGLPEGMDGMRVLEIGTWDGFWAFEMERRGADVTALDLDDPHELDHPPRRPPTEHDMDTPRGLGFELAKEVYASNVQRVICNVYDATPERLGGQFDLVFCGSVLIHLRDQLLALERIAGLVRPGGKFISAEEYEPRTAISPWPVARYLADRDQAVVFWLPSIRLWRRMMWTAGFERVEKRGAFKMRSEHGFSVRHVVLHAFK